MADGDPDDGHAVHDACPGVRASLWEDDKGAGKFPSGSFQCTGGNSSNHGGVLLPDALRWLWRSDEAERRQVLINGPEHQGGQLRYSRATEVLDYRHVAEPVSALA